MMEPIPPWPRRTRSYYVILRWDTDRPAVYVGHFFTQWRFWFHLRPKARFRRIDMYSPEAHRFFSEKDARLTCDAMPDLARLKGFLSIAELRDS